jgi:hypothetical protein
MAAMGNQQQCLLNLERTKNNAFQEASKADHRLIVLLAKPAGSYGFVAYLVKLVRCHRFLSWNTQRSKCSLLAPL